MISQEGKRWKSLRTTLHMLAIILFCSAPEWYTWDSGGTEEKELPLWHTSELFTTNRACWIQIPLRASGSYAIRWPNSVYVTEDSRSNGYLSDTSPWVSLHRCWTSSLLWPWTQSSVIGNTNSNLTAQLQWLSDRTPVWQRCMCVCPFSL